MADNLIFPIGFDLQKAVEKAGQDWDKTYAKKLETYLAKRPIKVKLNFENLTDVKTRLTQLKIEPITPETRASIKELARELQVLAKALEQVQKYSKNPAQLGQQNFRNDVQLEKLRQVNERLEIQKRRVALAEQKHAEALNRTTKASHEASAAIQAQDGYLSRLIKRTLAYASFNAIGTFLTRVREVTAQFELQRVSLGAIIQDQERANALFSEIKSFALKSPVSILDLTKYTKQLAAYKFETEELFDWTKRLTDISVGLGVSMDRVVLAAGQIRATGHLRSSEIRQLTEMGVPIVEELAAKLTQMNGELVTSADVLKLVEKRAISWGQVKEVFEDMTSAGGMFYQMQEKQGNTLYGLWAKLGDAASVMYEQIGNTESVNNAMKSSIQLLTDLMRNWRQVGQAIGIGLGGLAVAKGIKTFKGWQSNIDKAKIAANEQYIASSNAYRAAIKAEQAARATATAEEYRAIAAKTVSAEASYNAARAEYLAARNTTIWSKAWGKLKAAFLGNWVTLLLMGVAAIATSIYNVYEKANRLKKALAELKDESLVEADKSAFNFELLAKKAVEAADGSKEQREALQELQNTYKNIIPLQELSIEKLKELRGNYEAYTKAIRENIAVQSQQKQMDLVVEEYGKTILEAERRLKKEAKGVKITLFEADADGKTIERQVKLSNDQIDKYVAGVKYFASNTNKAQHEIRQMSLRLFVGLPENYKIAAEAFNYFDGANSSLVNNIRKQDVELENIQNSMSMYTASMGIFGDRWKQVADNIAKTPITGKAGSYLASRQKDLATINEYISALKDNFAAANIEWKESYATMVQSVSSETAELSTIDFAALKEVARKEGGDYAITLGNAIAEAEKGYTKLVPSDDIVNSLNRKLKSITLNTGASMDVMKKYLISGNDNIKDKLKSLTDSFDELTEKIYKFEQYNAKIAKGEIIGNVIPKEQIDALKEESKTLGLFIELLQALFAPKETGGRGGKSDPRLQNLKEEISLLQKLYTEYKKLEKQEGATKAAADMRRMAGDTLDMFKSKYNIDLPTDAKSLTAALEILYKKMAALPKKVFPALDKDLKELRWTIEKVDIDESQKNIEAELKRLSDRISRTKTAKEFYEKILEQTGDINIATRVSMSIYGSTGEELFNDTVEQIREAFKTGSEEHPIDLDISAAIDLENQRIDYKKLADIYDKYQDDIIEKRRETAKKIATEGQKEVATDILNWRKSLAKAKSYEQKRTDIINTATAERAKIIRETTDPKERGELLGLSYSKQAQELAKLAVDEFKSSDDYIKVFQDLDRVSTQTLDRMKKRLEEMIATVKDTENVEGLKTLVEQLDKIKEERETRNPIEGIIDSFKKYAKAREDYRTAEAEEAAAKAEFAQQEVGLNQAIQTAKAEQAIAQQRVNDLKAQGKENTSEGVAAELVLNEATKKVTQATENRNKAVKKVNNAEQKTTDALDAQKAALAKLQKNVNAMANAFNSAASSIKTIADMMGIAEDSELGDIVNGLVDGLNNAATIMTTILAIAIAIEAACWWMLAIGAAVAAFSAIGSWLTGSKVRKANKEIERQQKLLDQLEYTYGRLEAAADKLFGRDYVDNYNQQLKNLQAQQQAYLKQAEAERSKGKKEDEEKTKEYMNSAREAADKIADMQNQIAERMTNTDVTSAARDFASAWLEAYATFGDTSAAIKEKFNDMLQSMVVESVMGQVVQMALQPMFDKMNKMYKGHADMTDVLSYAFTESAKLSEDINNGLMVAAKRVESAGVDIKSLYQTSDNLTGISRDIASASEESINGLASGINTQNYYIAQQFEEVRRIRAIVEAELGGGVFQMASGGVDLVTLQNTAMGHLAQIEANTAMTAIRAEEAATAAAEIAQKLSKVIVSRGTKGSYGITTYLG